MDDDIVIHKRYKCKKVNCEVCGKELYRRPKGLDGSPIKCRSCTTAERNRKGRIDFCRICGIELTERTGTWWGRGEKRIKHTAYCKKCYSKIDREKRRELKQEVIDHFGGKCACCGETRLEFLTLDHVNNDGGVHRRETPNSLGTSLYNRLKANGFQSEYELQVLCWNCNMAKAYYGTCPHKMCD